MVCPVPKLENAECGDGGKDDDRGLDLTSGL
jgi:hypothetical protein